MIALVSDAQIGKHAMQDGVRGRQVVQFGHRLQLKESLTVQLGDLHDGGEEISTLHGEPVVLAVLLEGDQLNQAEAGEDRAHDLGIGDRGLVFGLGASR